MTNRSLATQTAYITPNRASFLHFSLLFREWKADVTQLPLKKNINLRVEKIKLELYKMIVICVANAIKFRYVLTDNWFASKESFKFILKKDKDFISALKDNRLVALIEEDKDKGCFVQISQLDLRDKQAVRVWMKGFPHKVLFVRRVFINKDGSIGLLNLVCSDLACSGEQVATIYQKRWKVEEFHKSIKSNAGLAKSPTRTIITQNNHIFMSIYAVFKLECLKIKHKANHFALRTKLFIKANQMAYEELQKLRAA